MIPNREFPGLLPRTADVLRHLLDDFPLLGHFSLVGGSALALHLQHRLSEDLDFFTWDSGQFSANDLLTWLSQQRANIQNYSDTQIDAHMNGVQLTFFNAGWSFLRPEAQQDLHIASLDDLAAMKAHTLFVRARFRDYYDLYTLLQNGMSLEHIYQQASWRFPGMTRKLFSIALTYVDDIADDSIAHLQPRVRIDKQQIREAFEYALANARDGFRSTGQLPPAAL